MSSEQDDEDHPQIPQIAQTGTGVKTNDAAPPQHIAERLCLSARDVIKSLSEAMPQNLRRSLKGIE